MASRSCLEKLSNDGEHGVLKRTFLLNEQDQRRSSELCSNFWSRSIYIALHFTLWSYCIMTTALAEEASSNFDWYKTVGILWLRTLLHRPEIDGRSLEATSERLRRRITLFSIWVRGDRNEGMICRLVCLPLNVSLIYSFISKTN